MVRYISDRMAVMYLGSLVEVGSSSEVFFDPKHPYTETLIASNPEADPEYERRRPSTTIQGEIPSPVNVPAGCRFANRCPQAMAHCRTTLPNSNPYQQSLRSQKGPSGWWPVTSTISHRSLPISDSLFLPLSQIRQGFKTDQNLSGNDLPIRSAILRSANRLRSVGRRRHLGVACFALHLREVLGL